MMNFFLTLSSIVFPLITFPYVSRILGPSGTGAVAMGISLTSYFTMVAMLGIPTYGIRACAMVRDNPEKLASTVRELLLINLIMGLIAYILFYIIIIFVPSFRSSFSLYSICSIAIFLNVIGVNWVYQALEDYSYITSISVLFKIIGLFLMFMFVKTKNDVNSYALVTVFSSFGAGIFNFIRLRNVVGNYNVGDLNLKRHMFPIFTFFAMSIATTIYTNLDNVMLGVIRNSTEVGYYNAATKIKMVLSTLVSSLGQVLLPRLSYYVEQDNKECFNRLISKAFSFVLLFSIPCAIFFSYYAKEVINILSGPEYLSASFTMVILMPTIVLIGFSNITGIQVLVPTGRENIVLKSVSIGAIIDFVLNCIFIPYYGSNGAAIGTLVAEFSVLIIQFWYLRKLVLDIVPSIEFKNLLISLLPALILLNYVKTSFSYTDFIGLIAGALVFFGVYTLGLIITKEEIITSVLRKDKII